MSKLIRRFKFSSKWPHSVDMSRDLRIELSTVVDRIEKHTRLKRLGCSTKFNHFVHDKPQTPYVCSPRELFVSIYELGSLFTTVSSNPRHCEKLVVVSKLVVMQPKASKSCHSSASSVASVPNWVVVIALVTRHHAIKRVQRHRHRIRTQCVQSCFTASLISSISACTMTGGRIAWVSEQEYYKYRLRKELSPWYAREIQFQTWPPCPTLPIASYGRPRCGIEKESPNALTR